MGTESLTLGRGKLYIAPWGGIGDTPPQESDYDFVGSCEEISLNITTEELEHIDWTEGIASIDEQVSIRTDYKGTFTTDYITNNNLMRYLKGTKVGATIRAMTALEVRFALKFVSNNPKGPNKTIICHKAKLSPASAMALVGKEWQKIQFNFTGLKDVAYNPNSPYFDVVLTSTTTSTTTTTTSV